jgi:hypothetical protein
LETLKVVVLVDEMVALMDAGLVDEKVELKDDEMG